MKFPKVAKQRAFGDLSFQNRIDLLRRFPQNIILVLGQFLFRKKTQEGPPPDVGAEEIQSLSEGQLPPGGITGKILKSPDPKNIAAKHVVCDGTKTAAKVAMKQGPVRLFLEGLEMQIFRFGAFGIKPIGLLGLTVGRVRIQD